MEEFEFEESIKNIEKSFFVDDINTFKTHIFLSSSISIIGNNLYKQLEFEHVAYKVKNK